MRVREGCRGVNCWTTTRAAPHAHQHPHRQSVCRNGCCCQSTLGSNSLASPQLPAFLPGNIVLAPPPSQFPALRLAALSHLTQMNQKCVVNFFFFSPTPPLQAWEDGGEKTCFRPRPIRVGPSPLLRPRPILLGRPLLLLLHRYTREGGKALAFQLTARTAESQRTHHAVLLLSTSSSSSFSRIVAVMRLVLRVTLRNT